jgi:hypothetical protein
MRDGRDIYVKLQVFIKMPLTIVQSGVFSVSAFFATKSAILPDRPQQIYMYGIYYKNKLTAACCLSGIIYIYF